jgi:hypothetical protein
MKIRFWRREPADTWKPSLPRPKAVRTCSLSTERQQAIVAALEDHTDGSLRLLEGAISAVAKEMNVAPSYVSVVARAAGFIPAQSRNPRYRKEAA